MEKDNFDYERLRDELRRFIEQNEDTEEFRESSPEREEIEKDKGKEQLDDKILTKHDASSVLYAIDDDIQRMRTELQETVELFQNASKSFESINFNSLKHRIRDLHLSATKSEMLDVMQENNVDKGLSKLTDIMGNKFRQHPGEFGDIPEVSCFFRACSQLQNGLENLKKQRSEMDVLGNRVNLEQTKSKQTLEQLQAIISKQNM